tara:strand:- start:182 stop:712 length:531 start_codon:yes stop_codon:yes gene_type:complete
MKLASIITATTLALASCSPAIAFQGATGKFTVQGTVIDVEPRYSKVTTNNPQQHCKIVEVPIYQQKGGDVIGNIIGGAIIGGIIGNNVVKGDGSGAAGAVIGSIIGNEKGKQKQSTEIVGYKQVNKCHTHNNYETVERRDGSVVVVEYAGGRLKFSTERNYNIGDKVPLYMDLTVR